MDYVVQRPKGIVLTFLQKSFSSATELDGFFGQLPDNPNKDEVTLGLFIHCKRNFYFDELMIGLAEKKTKRYKQFYEMYGNDFDDRNRVEYLQESVPIQSATNISELTQIVEDKPDTVEYKIKNIRRLLKASFRDSGEMYDFIDDEFTELILDINSTDSQVEMARMLINYIRSRHEFGILLEKIRQCNPNAFEKYGPYFK